MSAAGVARPSAAGGRAHRGRADGGAARDPRRWSRRWSRRWVALAVVATAAADHITQGAAGAGVVAGIAAGVASAWPARAAAQVIDPPGSSTPARAELRAMSWVAGVSVPVALPRNGRVDVSAYGVRVTAPSSASGAVEARLHLGPHVTLAPAYSYLVARRAAGPDYREHRPRVDLTGSGALAGVGLAGRAMAERRLSNTRDWTVVRARLRAERPLTAGGQEVVRPFAYTESFYDASGGSPRGGAVTAPTAGWFRQWTAVGVSRDLGPHLHTELSYLRQSERRGPGADANMLGVLLVLRPLGSARPR